MAKRSRVADRENILMPVTKAARERLLTVRERLLTVRERLLTVRERLLTVRERLLTVRERLLTVRERLLTVRERLLTVRERLLTVLHLRTSRQNIVELDSKDSSKLACLANDVDLLHYLQVSTSSDHVILDGPPTTTVQDHLGL